VINTATLVNNLTLSTAVLNILHVYTECVSELGDFATQFFLVQQQCVKLKLKKKFIYLLRSCVKDK
jgi:hypothetical protein